LYLVFASFLKYFSFYLFFLLCSRSALYWLPSEQRAGNRFAICDNHQHLHRFAAAPADPLAAPQPLPLPGRPPAAQDAAACSAAAAVPVHLVGAPAFNNHRMPRLVLRISSSLCPLVLLNVKILQKNNQKENFI